MGSALRNTSELSADAAASEPAPALSGTETGSADALRRLVAERLAAHRGRRTHAEPSVGPPGSAAHTPRAAQIAAAVAARYANSISYRAYLAAEAERAIQEAQAAAEIARLNAQAIAEAQQRLLENIEAELAAAPDAGPDVAQDLAEGAEPHGVAPQSRSLWSEEPGIETEELLRQPVEPHCDEAPGNAARRETGPEHPLRGSSPVAAQRSSSQSSQRSRQAAARESRSPRSAEPDLFTASEPVVPGSGATPAFIVRLGGDALPAAITPPAPRIASTEASDPEARALDEEISFRHDPVFEAPPEPPEPLPANLIEFPRQLVAPRKARPRLAEGPLREETDVVPAAGQLRIFEVEPAQISTTPEAIESEASAGLQWSSILLGSSPDGSARPASVAAAAASSHPRPQTAPPGRRVRAAMVDLAVVVIAFAAAATACSTALLHAAGEPVSTALHRVPAAALELLRSPERPMALGVAAVAFVLLWIVYQLLCFTFSEATAGMRAARIALCTLSDENPTRREMRRRIPMVLLSVCCLGLGFLWTAIDEDSLTWHDLISRMYQRGY